MATRRPSEPGVLDGPRHRRVAPLARRVGCGSRTGAREEIVAVDLEGNVEVVGRGPSGFGWSIEWLPDGRMLLTGPELLRHEPDGTRVRHADLGTHRGRRLERDRRRRPRQHLRQQHRLRLHGRRTSRSQPPRASSRSSHPTARRAKSPTASRSRTAWSITPDGSTLIVSESFAGRLLAFDIAR